MLRYCFAILAASCAFGQPVQVGILLQSKDFLRAALIPAARYADGKWSEMYDQRLSWQWERLPSQWQLWGSGFEGAAVHIRSVCAPTDPCGLPCRPNLCWESDFRGRRSSSGLAAEVGVVISPAMRVTSFQKVASGSAEWHTADAIFQPAVKKAMDSLLATQTVEGQKLKPTRVAPLKTGYMLSSSEPIEGQEIYYARYESRFYDKRLAPQLEPDCAGYLAYVFEGWIVLSPAGEPDVASTQSQIDSCQPGSNTYSRLQPSGVVSVGGLLYAVGQESYSESAGIALVKLGQGSATIVVRHLWGLP